MKKLLIVCPSQYGYRIDTYYHIKYLEKYFNITCICLDYNLPKINPNKANIIYISRKGNHIVRYFRYLKSASKLIKTNKFDVVFIDYFILCSFLKIINYNKIMILDIRSGKISINNNLTDILIFNNILKIESVFFKNITIISDTLRKYLNIPSRKSHILPVGAEIINKDKKTFSDLNLLYVGTLSTREIEKTIIGFSKFYNKYKNLVNLSYDIIGYGSIDDEMKINSEIIRNKLSNVVHFIGRIQHNKLGPYFKKCNVGIAFIPTYIYYQYQPPTKIFEYLLSGLAVIATNTIENKKIINIYNGVIIQDNSESFFHGLERIWNNRKLYKSDNIRFESKAYLWENIVEKNLKIYINKVIYN